jgi:F0F1-type ATP synthase gamma subunit
MLVVLSGDRGLCGGYNNFIIKKVRLHAGARAALRGRLHTDF